MLSAETLRRNTVMQRRYGNEVFLFSFSSLFLHKCYSTSINVISNT